VGGLLADADFSGEWLQAAPTIASVTATTATAIIIFNFINFLSANFFVFHWPPFVHGGKIKSQFTGTKIPWSKKEIRSAPTQGTPWALTG
jgi:hypothetical protein